MNGTACADDVQTTLDRTSVPVPKGRDTGTGNALAYAAVHETGQSVISAEPTHTAAAVGHRSVQRRMAKGIDDHLLKRAREIIESIDPLEDFETQLNLDALKGTVAEMWESAAQSSEIHKDILSILESGVRSSATAGHVTAGQLTAFREALSDLEQTRLVAEHAQSLRDEFIRQGFVALGFASQLEEAEDET